MKERKRKMINAEEARVLSNKVNNSKEKIAREWALNECSFLEDRIRRAADEGKYDTDYWWSKELLEETGLTQRLAWEALKETMNIFGYTVNATFNCGAKGLLKIYISWEREKDNE